MAVTYRRLVRAEYMQGHNWIDTAGLGIAALALAGEDARPRAGWRWRREISRSCR